jgi:hypothetical protein
MATFTFQRGAWCLQISRTSRNLSVSFSTALPRRSRAYHLPSQAKQYQDCPRPKSTSLPKASRHQQARTAFTSTKVYQAQQSAATQVRRLTKQKLQSRNQNKRLIHVYLTGPFQRHDPRSPSRSRRPAHSPRRKHQAGRLGPLLPRSLHRTLLQRSR